MSSRAAATPRAGTSTTASRTAASRVVPSSGASPATTRKPATSTAASASTRQTLLDFPLSTPPAAASGSGGPSPSTAGGAATAAAGTTLQRAQTSAGAGSNAANASRAAGGGGTAATATTTTATTSGSATARRPLTARGTHSSGGGGSGGPTAPKTASSASNATGRIGAAATVRRPIAGSTAARAAAAAANAADGSPTDASLDVAAGASGRYHQHFLDRDGEVPFPITPALLQRAQRASCGYHSAKATGNAPVRFRSDFDKAALRFAANEHGLFEIVGGALLVGEHHHNPHNVERNAAAAAAAAANGNAAADGTSAGSLADSDTPANGGDSPSAEPLSSPPTPTTAASPAAERQQRYEWSGLHLNSYTGPWNFFWGSVQQVRAMFDPQMSVRLRDDQIINHFPNHVELTRKDLMYKNLRRYLRENTSARGGGSGASFGATAEGPTNPATGRRLAECVPVTFSLPNDLSLFTEEYKKTPGQTWIIKPSNRSQGRGIFLINRFAQLQSWLRERAEEGDRDPYIASRYVARPLLIAGKKFDLRLYVLVLSYKPLVAYLHEEGFARFCSTLYTEPKSNVDISEEPLGAHLTNVAFQKGEDDYNDSHGGKWTLKNLWLFVEGAFGHAEANAMLSDIQFLVLNTLLSVQSMVHNDKHAFELYGYDILLDDELRPHLIEVNASPSLRITTSADRAMKSNVLLDTFRLVCPVVRQPYASAAPPAPPTPPPQSLSPSKAAGPKTVSAKGAPKGSSATSPSAAAAGSGYVPPPFVYTAAYNSSEVPFAEYKRRPDLQAAHTGGFHFIDAGGR